MYTVRYQRHTLDLRHRFVGKLQNKTYEWHYSSVALLHLNVSTITRSHDRFLCFYVARFNIFRSHTCKSMSWQSVSSINEEHNIIISAKCSLLLRYFSDVLHPAAVLLSNAASHQDNIKSIVFDELTCNCSCDYCLGSKAVDPPLKNIDSEGRLG